MRHRIASIVLIASMLHVGAIVLVPPDAEGSTKESEGVVVLSISGVEIYADDPAWQEYQWQRDHGAPPIDFWVSVAHCETRQDWNNTGRFAGGLGIMTAKTFPKGGMGTWERWGGEQFAPRPNHATPLQQIVVANRIAMFGWEAKFRRWDGRQMRVREKHYVKHKTGFNGWGCIRDRRNGSKWGTINPRRFEVRTPRPRLTYEIFQLTVPLNVPRYAWSRVPHKYLR